MGITIDSTYAGSCPTLAGLTLLMPQNHHTQHLLRSRHIRGCGCNDTSNNAVPGSSTSSQAAGLAQQAAQHVAACTDTVFKVAPASKAVQRYPTHIILERSWQDILYGVRTLVSAPPPPPRPHLQTTRPVAMMCRIGNAMVLVGCYNAATISLDQADPPRPSSLRTVLLALACTPCGHWQLICRPRPRVAQSWPWSHSMMLKMESAATNLPLLTHKVLRVNPGLL